MIIDCDSSQIEARTLAWLAEQDDLVEAFQNGEDVYKKMAAAIYNKEEDAVSKEERFVGKTTILGAGYGMGAVKFSAQLKTFGVDFPTLIFHFCQNQKIHILLERQMQMASIGIHFYQYPKWFL